MLHELFDAEEVIAVAVGDVDVCQVAVVGLDPVDELLVLLDRQECVDQNRVALPIDQCGGVGYPFQVFFARRDVPGEPWSAHTKGLVLQRRRWIGHGTLLFSWCGY
jgi:hypothetical protein